MEWEVFMSQPQPPQPPPAPDDTPSDTPSDTLADADGQASALADAAPPAAAPAAANQDHLERQLDAQLARFTIDGPQLKPALLDHLRKQPPSRAAAELTKRTSASLRLKGHDLLAERSASPSDYLKALAEMFNDAVATRSLDHLREADAPAYPKAALDAVQKRLATGATQVDVSTLLAVAARPFAHQGQVERPRAKLLWRVQSLRVTWHNHLPEPYRVYYQMLARYDLPPAAARDLSPEALDDLAFARFAAEAAAGALSLPLEGHLSGALTPPHAGAATWWSDSDAPPSADPADAGARDWYAAGFIKLGFKPKDLSLRSPTIYDALAYPAPEGEGRRWISTDAVSIDKAARVGLLRPATTPPQPPTPAPAPEPAPTPAPPDTAGAGAEGDASRGRRGESAPPPKRRARSSR
jgi:hypothetical protein